MLTTVVGVVVNSFLLIIEKVWLVIIMYSFAEGLDSNFVTQGKLSYTDVNEYIKTAFVLNAQKWYMLEFAIR